MGACKSCTSGSQPQPSTEFQPSNPDSRSGAISELKRILSQNSFDDYLLEKKTIYEISYSGTLRTLTNIKSKQINSRGTLKPIELERLKQVNEQLKVLKEAQPILHPEMAFRCSLELQESFPDISLHNLMTQAQESLQFTGTIEIYQEADRFTLIRSWGQGELMDNFESAKDLIEKYPNKLSLIGFSRGNDDSVFLELVKSNSDWQKYKQYFLNIEDPNDQGHILDIFFNEQTNYIEPNQSMSALLFYGQKLVWKRYVGEWDICSDSEEVAKGVAQTIENIQSIGINTKRANQQSSNYKISNEEYRALKKVILNFKENKAYTRDLKIKISKTTLYSKEKKVVFIEEPNFELASSAKSQSAINSILRSIDQKHNVKNEIWLLQILKDKLKILVGQHKLNVVAILEKTIKIRINWSEVIINQTPWERGSLQPYYKSTQEIAQVKQWIMARDIILPELEESISRAQDNVSKRIDEMLRDFFKTIPNVEKVLNQTYGRIPYAEKRKPPYEEMSVSKSLGNEEIARKPNMTLIILMIDYENEDTINQLKSLINYKTRYNKADLQIAVLGHIRAESWTKTFQDFMVKYELSKYAENGDIETWFPIEDKIGSISFSAILSKMYGMALERRDCVIVDQNNVVREIDSSRKIIPRLGEVLKNLESKVQFESDRMNYNAAWKKFKQVLRDNPSIEEICNKLKKDAKEDDWLIHIEQKQQRVMEFEGDVCNESKKQSAPSRLVRGYKEVPALDELSTLIQKYIAHNEFTVLK